MPAALIPPVPLWSENYAFMVNDTAQRIAMDHWDQSDISLWVSQILFYCSHNIDQAKSN